MAMVGTPRLGRLQCRFSASVAEPCLWYFVYGTHYRSQFELPQQVLDKIRGLDQTQPEQQDNNHKNKKRGNRNIVTNSLGDDTSDESSNCHGNYYSLQLRDLPSWKELVVQREQLARRTVNTASIQNELVYSSAVVVAAAISETEMKTGDEENKQTNIKSSRWNKNSVLLFRKRDLSIYKRHPAKILLKRTVVSHWMLPLARPVAYVEFCILGGASVGLDWESTPIEQQLRNSMSTSMNEHVGWSRYSIGYHGDEGKVYLGEGVFGEGHAFGPTFGFDPDQIQINNATNAPWEHDIVGVGFEQVRSYSEDIDEGDFVVFFTKNGDFVGSVHVKEIIFVRTEAGETRRGLNWIRGDASSSGRFSSRRASNARFVVSLDSSGAKCFLNWGGQRFLFDIERYALQPRPEPKLTT